MDLVSGAPASGGRSTSSPPRSTSPPPSAPNGHSTGTSAPNGVTATPAHPGAERGLTTSQSPPTGRDGGEAPACRCGAGPHPEHADRCAGGHPLVGYAHRLSTKSGARSLRYWEGAADAVTAYAAEVLSDLGHPIPEDAPAVARRAAVALARAAVLAESCWWRVAESGGPLAASGKTRAAYKAWLEADKRAESWSRLLGLARVPRPVETIGDYIAARAAQQADDSGDGGAS